MCFVFLTGFDGSLKTNTFNCQQKHRRIYKQCSLLETSQESIIFITDLSSFTLLITRAQINVFEITLQEKNLHGNENSAIWPLKICYIKTLSL